MEKLYCVIRNKSEKFGKPKISSLLGKTLVISNICSKGKNEDAKLLKKMNWDIENFWFNWNYVITYGWRKHKSRF